MKQKRKKSEENISQYRQNFYNIYHTNIIPIFNEFEGKRKKEFIKLLLIELVICGVDLWLCYSFFSSIMTGGDAYKSILNQFIPGILFITTIVAIWLPFHFNNKFIQTLKLQCMDKVIKAFGNLKWYDCSNLITDNELEKSQLFASYTRRRKLDAFKGKYKDVTFQISETELLSKSLFWGNNGNLVTIFKGVIIKFKANKDIKSTTIIATKGDNNIKNRFSIIPLILYVLGQWGFCFFIESMNFTTEPAYVSWYLGLTIVWVAVFILIGIFFNKNTKNTNNTYKMAFEEIKLEDPEFTKKYKAYSTDQIEGRYLITPAFMQRFKNIQTAFRTNKVKCSFYGEDLMFAISTRKNLFEIGNLFCSLNNPKQMTKFFDELSSIIALIDYFKLDETTKL